MTTSLEQQREDQALGAAWRRAEAALPAGCLRLTKRAHGRARFIAWTTYRIRVGRGSLYSAETPTEALTALAEDLEAL